MSLQLEAAVDKSYKNLMDRRAEEFKVSKLFLLNIHLLQSWIWWRKCKIHVWTELGFLPRRYALLLFILLIGPVIHFTMLMENNTWWQFKQNSVLQLVRKYNKSMVVQGLVSLDPSSLVHSGYSEGVFEKIFLNKYFASCPSHTVVCMTAHACWSRMCQATRLRYSRLLKTRHNTFCSLDYILLNCRSLRMNNTNRSYARDVIWYAM